MASDLFEWMEKIVNESIKGHIVKKQRLLFLLPVFFACYSSKGNTNTEDASPVKDVYSDVGSDANRNTGRVANIDSGIDTGSDVVIDTNPVEDEKPTCSDLLPASKYDEIVASMCGTKTQAQCFVDNCQYNDYCPLIIAFSDDAIFRFFNTDYVKCERCNTDPFSICEGVGRCVEYRITELPDLWKVDIWISDKCSFRFGEHASNSAIAVLIDKTSNEIQNITPEVEYIDDSYYCQGDDDCRCLSGSGLPFIGCSNILHASLHIAGDFACDSCICRQNRCVEQ